MPNLTAALGGISGILIPTFEVGDRGSLDPRSRRRRVRIEASGLPRVSA
jgi:hypothetical protein